jgi:hypothetical protein
MYQMGNPSCARSSFRSSMVSDLEAPPLVRALGNWASASFQTRTHKQSQAQQDNKKPRTL